MYRGRRSGDDGQAIYAQIENEVMDLCSRNMASLSRYAASLTPKQPIIQAAMKEAFQRYFFTRMGGAQIENPRAWIARVLRNEIMDRCRKSDLMPDLDLISPTAPATNEEDLEECQDRAFRRALASLSERERECLQLRIEGYVYDELAQIMQISKGAVGSLLSRALKNFRDAEAFEEQSRSGAIPADTYNLITQVRLSLAENAYQRRVQQRIWTYVFMLGLLTAAAALATVLMK